MRQITTLYTCDLCKGNKVAMDNKSYPQGWYYNTMDNEDYCRDCLVKARLPKIEVIQCEHTGWYTGIILVGGKVIYRSSEYHEGDDAYEDAVEKNKILNPES